MTKISYNPELRLFSTNEELNQCLNIINDLGKHAGLIMSRSNPELGKEILDRVAQMDRTYITVPIGKASKQFHFQSDNDLSGDITECFYNFDSNVNVNHLLNKRSEAELVYDNQLYELKYLGDLNFEDYRSQVFLIHNKKTNEEYLEIDEVIIRNYIYQYLENKNSTVA